MKKTLIILGCMGIGFTHAQQQGREHTQHTGATKRVGINTEKPVASFEVSKVNNIPATQVQGFLLPHLSQTERNAMQKEALTNGLMIFNTSKNCIDWWDGTNWQCTDDTQKDEHGDEYARYRATFSYTATATFTKSCPTGQIGSKEIYTPATPIIGRGSSNVSQADAERIAEANAKEEFNRLGQEEANRKGTCKRDVLAKCRSIIEASEGNLAVYQYGTKNYSSWFNILYKVNNGKIPLDRLAELVENNTHEGDIYFTKFGQPNTFKMSFPGSYVNSNGVELKYTPNMESVTVSVAQDMQGQFFDTTDYTYAGSSILMTTYTNEITCNL